MAICEKCGSELKQGAIICRNCGTRVSNPVNTGDINSDKPPKTKEVNVENIAKQESSMSVGAFIIMDLVMLVPCVNIVMLVVWAFGKQNVTRSNYAKAKLLIAIIGGILGALVMVLMGASLFASLGSAVNNF